MHREAQAAIDGNAVTDADAPRVGEGLIEREAAFQVRVGIDHGNVCRADADDVAIDVVDLRALVGKLRGGIGQRADTKIAKECGALRAERLQRECAVADAAVEVRIR